LYLLLRKCPHHEQQHHQHLVHRHLLVDHLSPKKIILLETSPGKE
jgi:hypothetical protein